MFPIRSIGMSNPPRGHHRAAMVCGVRPVDGPVRSFRPTMSPRETTVLVLFSALLLNGCSSGDGQQRYRVSGDVKFDGQPVPYGEVLVTPDGSKGNSGAQGIADIKDGKYDTQGSRAPGFAGGPTVVRVMAFRDAGGKELICEYEYQADLPKSATTHNIDVPASAGKKKLL